MRQVTDSWLRGLLAEGDGCIALSGMCHDCGEPVLIDVDGTPDKYGLSGGLVWKYAERDKVFLKCPECAERDPVLRNFQPTEVFSRVCGYLTPVQRWNKGKREEFRQRKTYSMEKATA